MQPTQYTLAVTLPDDETLQSFFGAKESPAVQFIEQFLAPGKPQLPLYLFGASGSGKSHLLYAACVQAQEQGLTSQLLALDDFRQYSPRLFDGLEQLDLVCLDNLVDLLDLQDPDILLDLWDLQDLQDPDILLDLWDLQDQVRLVGPLDLLDQVDLQDLGILLVLVDLVGQEDLQE